MEFFPVNNITDLHVVMQVKFVKIWDLFHFIAGRLGRFSEKNKIEISNK